MPLFATPTSPVDAHAHVYTRLNCSVESLRARVRSSLWKINTFDGTRPGGELHLGAASSAVAPSGRLDPGNGNFLQVMGARAHGGWTAERGGRREMRLIDADRSSGE